MSFTSAIITGIQQHLAADATLRELLGATTDAPKIGFGPFEGSPVPCVTLLLVSADNDPAMEEDHITSGMFQADCYVQRRFGESAALAIGERVHWLLNRVAPASGVALKITASGFPVSSTEEDVCRSMQEFEFSCG